VDQGRSARPRSGAKPGKAKGRCLEGRLGVVFGVIHSFGPVTIVSYRIPIDLSYQLHVNNSANSQVFTHRALAWKQGADFSST